VYVLPVCVKGVLALCFFAIAGISSELSVTDVSITFLNVLDFNNSQIFGLDLMELSSLAPLSSTEVSTRTFAVISDDSELPRFFTVELQGFGFQSNGEDFAANWLGGTILSEPNNIDGGDFDTEGIAVWPRGSQESPNDVLLITTDAALKEDGTYISASVQQYALNGTLYRNIALPELLTNNVTGYYHNRGFEAADIIEVDRGATGNVVTRLMIAGEFALAADHTGQRNLTQDGSAAPVPIRWVQYEACAGCDKGQWSETAEYVYELMLPENAWRPQGTAGTTRPTGDQMNGLVELSFLPGAPDGQYLLAMERAWHGVPDENVVLLFLVDLAGATDVCGCDALATTEETANDAAANGSPIFGGLSDPGCVLTSLKPLNKILLANLTQIAADAGLNLENAEAMAVLAGKWRSEENAVQQFRLVVMNDNGANPDTTPTHIALFDVQFSVPPDGTTEGTGDNTTGDSTEYEAATTISSANRVLFTGLFMAFFGAVIIIVSLVVWHYSGDGGGDGGTLQFREPKQRYDNLNMAEPHVDGLSEYDSAHFSFHQSSYDHSRGTAAV